MLEELPKLLNPTGTATREDLIEVMKILSNILTGRPQDSWTMVSDLIDYLNH